MRFTLLSIPVLLFSVIIHEVSHGWMAERRGDPTARYAGRLTLNPLPHIDLFGSILLPALLLLSQSPILFGYAKPVPINPYNLHNPKKDLMWIGLSGPLSNILIAFVCGLLFRILYRPGMMGILNPFIALFTLGVIINLVLALFNMIPIPPLDGSRVVLHFLPPDYEYAFRNLERYGMFIVFGLLFLGPMLGLHIFSWIIYGLGNPICYLFTGLSINGLYGALLQLLG
jgi:Zn-dependent protease